MLEFNWEDGTLNVPPGAGAYGLFGTRGETCFACILKHDIIIRKEVTVPELEVVLKISNEDEILKGVKMLHRVDEISSEVIIKVSQGYSPQQNILDHEASIARLRKHAIMIGGK